MSPTDAQLLRKCVISRDAVRKCESMLETARQTHRAAILAATEGGLAQREVARHLGVSEVVLRDKLARARVERA
jgi:DNA-directed RNA polymerase specialized sigma24 family protein